MDYKLISERQPGIGLLEQILINRGITMSEVHHFLHADENDVLSPTLLDNMREGAQTLSKHIANNNRALIVVDSDCDGYCSSAIFLNYFNKLFNLTFMDTLDHFRKNKDKVIDELKGMKTFDSIKQDFKDDEDYLDDFSFDGVENE